MNVLVVGSYPPSFAASTPETVRTVREYLDAGDDVHVLGSEPGAAHEDANLRGWRGILALIPRCRRFDRMVLQMDVGMFLLPETGRIRRSIDCVVLGCVLRLAKPTELRFVDLAVIPKSVGGRAARFLWAGADRIVVSSEHDRHLLLTGGGVDEERLRLEPSVQSTEIDLVEEPSIPDVQPLESWQGLDDDADRSEVQRQIQARSHL